ncbi:chromosome partitioning protein ParB (plasmid) [Bradyrhizobium barranii subsp. apii]|uniref:Chromosome partitioning protein ParB n=1 Tax=Bradyrhizobium barranii subsp. apii TaxID=2819348 RepID=A0A8T5VIG0_9BRAD|nr:KorB domain-containing protein [Bradyrhizobium barranii]UPT92300.1 chromosome partitioning protein ParB [Bradyrhizobium barranii subsp. apii]
MARSSRPNASSGSALPSKVCTIVLLPSNFNTKSPRQRSHLEQLLREAGKYVFPGQIVARDGYAEAVAERLPVWKLKRRSAQEAGREIRDVLAKIVAQMIENIQRDNLNAPEIAAFIADRLEEGDNQADISRKLGKPRDWVSRYASVQSMPEFLRSKLAGSSIRAVYELYQAWRERPNAVETLCAAQESFTDAHARQLARKIRSEARGSHDGGEGAPAAQPARSPMAPQAPLRPIERDRVTATAKRTPSPSADRNERMSPSLTIRVRHQDRMGCLLVDRSASQGSRHAVLLIDGADEAEEVPASTITIEEILVV